MPPIIGSFFGSPEQAFTIPTIANAKHTKPISPVISVPTKDKIPKLVTEITKEIPLLIMLSATLKMKQQFRHMEIYVLVPKQGITFMN